MQHEKIKNLKQHLKSKLIGQNHVLEPIADLVTRGELGLSPTDRPKAQMFLAGPTGVGKTETVQVICNYLYGHPPTIFDMGEFKDNEAIPRLIERLCKTNDQHPNGTFYLFDEIEKAHSEVFDIFLALLQGARLTDQSGETRDFHQSYFAFTSNIGGAEVMRMRHSSLAQMERAIFSSLSAKLRPEFLGRFMRRIFTFKKLDHNDQRKIAEIMVRSELSRLKNSHDIELELSECAFEFIVREGTDKYLGARPMLGTIESSIGQAIADTLLDEQDVTGQLVASDCETHLKLKTRLDPQKV